MKNGGAQHLPPTEIGTALGSPSAEVSAARPIDMHEEEARCWHVDLVSPGPASYKLPPPATLSEPCPHMSVLYPYFSRETQRFRDQVIATAEASFRRAVDDFLALAEAQTIDADEAHEELLKLSDRMGGGAQADVYELHAESAVLAHALGDISRVLQQWPDDQTRLQRYLDECADTHRHHILCRQLSAHRDLLKQELNTMGAIGDVLNRAGDEWVRTALSADAWEKRLREEHARASRRLRALEERPMPGEMDVDGGEERSGEGAN
ncbi:hypothetical protein L226DRAFT_527503 [Lentinus tigrinus ALCF2SS1-7]|uniref:uncharacterized protein n=1 Tax=Lentinus tigrinus ALCF2SS1-7 TaxID=1328758 RepID=UPI00116623AE|nr:hypothetical protein L226DRAFT_527503 [Lentinus tigrinus ALCF2SS1-7]